MVLGARSSVRKDVRGERVAAEPAPHATGLSRGLVPRPFGAGSHRGSRRNERLTQTYQCEKRAFNPASFHRLAASIKTDEMLTNAHVETIEMVSCGLVGDDSGVPLFCSALAANKSLKRLELCGNNLGANPSHASDAAESFAAHLSRALVVNRALTELGLNDNLLRDTGAEALAPALRENRTLQSLGLRGNAIGVAGCALLGDALSLNVSLRALDLSHNMLGDEGCHLLCAALSSMAALEWLDISDNHIGDDGAQAVGALLQESASLQDLDVSYNQIKDPGPIGAALRTNSALTRLDLHTNPLGATESQLSELNAGIQENSTLQILDLSHIGLVPRSSAGLVAALACNKSLVSVDLSCNIIGSSVGTCLAQALKAAKSPMSTLRMEQCGLGLHATQNLGSLVPDTLKLELRCNYAASDEADLMPTPNK